MLWGVTGLHGFTYIIIISFTPLFYFSFWFCLRSDMKFSFNKHVFEGACEKILYKCVWFSIKNQFLDSSFLMFGFATLKFCYGRQHFFLYFWFLCLAHLKHFPWPKLKFSMTLIKIPWLSRPGKWFFKIPWLSRFSMTRTNPGQIHALFRFVFSSLTANSKIRIS